MRDFDIAVVGGGASGALTASWLLRLSSGPLSIALIEQSGRFGTGAAYGTRQPVHLLNVTAARMSADPEDPEHLLRWLRRRGHEVQPEAFIPRSLYGDYLQDFLGEAEVRAAPGVELHRIPMEAVGFDSARRGLRLASGELLRARQVVLAIGNLPPSPLQVPGFEALAASERYLHSPWSTEVRQLSSEASLTLIGTGLTAVDLLLSLDAQGHRGSITLLSRHALLPRPHAPRGEPPPLLQSLADEGLARIDRYGLLTDQGRVLDGAGGPQWWLHALGPLRRSELWETTAIPEIRSQARQLAQTLLTAESREQRARG